MNEFWRNLESSSWWIGVVVVGILINILAAYLKPWIDSLMSRVSTRWATRNQKLRDERTKRIAFLRHDSNEQVLTSNRKVENLLFCILSLIMGGFLWIGSLLVKLHGPIVVSLLLLLMSTLSLVSSIMSFRDAKINNSELREAREMSDHPGNGTTAIGKINSKK